MGVQDTSTKDFLSDADVFADAVNYYLYGGERVVKPAFLNPLDSHLLLHVFGCETENRKQQEKQRDRVVERYRDVVRQWNAMTDNNCTYVIFGIEAQTHTNYAMPVKSIVYDVMQYAQQVEEFRVKHRKEGSFGSREEFLSGLHKDDHLVPVITICIYFGTEPWDGALSLRDLFDLQDERLLPYIQDYKVLLIDPFTMSEKDFEKFSTNLGQVLRFMKATSDKRKMAELMKDESAYGGLNRKAARVIRDCAHINVQTEKEEEVNMCKAWEDAMEDAANAARLQEREEAQEREKELCKAWEEAKYAAANAARLQEREEAQEREKDAIICVSIDTYRELDIPEGDIRKRIMRKYILTEKEADSYMACARA